MAFSDLRNFIPHPAPNCSDALAPGDTSFFSKLVLSVALVCVAALSVSGPAWSASLKPVRFAFPALNGVFFPVWVAKETGIFEKQGLDVSISYIAGNNRLTAAMVGGSIDIGVGGSASVDANARKASDLVFVATILQRAVTFMFVRPEIRTISDLKGKMIATTGKATLTDDAAHIILEHNRIPASWVKFVYTNSESANLTSLLAGNVAAAVFTPPMTLTARQSGMIEMASPAAIDYPYLQGSVVVLRRYLAAEREVVKAFLRGLVEGLREGKANPDRAVDIMGKYLKGDNREALLEAYRTFSPFLPERPEVPLQAIRNVSALHGLGLDEAAVERMVDNSLVREVLGEAGK